MSKRKRHSKEQTENHQIEWFKHRKGYPSPEERDRIIRLRKEISFEFIKLMVMNVKSDDPRMRALIQKYSADEIERISRIFGESA